MSPHAAIALPNIEPTPGSTLETDP